MLFYICIYIDIYIYIYTEREREREREREKLIIGVYKSSEGYNFIYKGNILLKFKKLADKPD